MAELVSRPERETLVPSYRSAVCAVASAWGLLLAGCGAVETERLPSPKPVSTLPEEVCPGAVRDIAWMGSALAFAQDSSACASAQTRISVLDPQKPVASASHQCIDAVVGAIASDGEALFLSDVQNDAIKRLRPQQESLTTVAMAEAVRPGPATVAADLSHIYWIDARGLCARQKEGGETTVIQADAIGPLISDDTYLYWVRNDGIVRMAKAGAEVEYVAPTQNRIYAMAIFGPSMVWAEENSVLMQTRLASSGGFASEMIYGAASGRTPTSLIVDGEFVYFSDHLDAADYRISKIALRGAGEPTTIVEGAAVIGAKSLTTSATHLYWGDENSVKRIAK